MSETPRTEAGRRLYRDYRMSQNIVDAILAIEAEAASEPRPESPPSGNAGERTPSENVSDVDAIRRAVVVDIRGRILALRTFGRYRVDMASDRAVMLEDVLAVLALPFLSSSRYRGDR